MFRRFTILNRFKKMSNNSLFQFGEKTSSALCIALGTAGTVLVLECFRIPHCYMSLSLAATLSLLPRPTLSHVLALFAALSLGILTSMALLIAFFQAPWLSFPLAGFIAAFGYALFFKHSGPGSAYAFGACFLALYTTATHSDYGNDLLIQGLKIWAQTIVPIVMTYLAAALTKKHQPPQTYPKIDFGSIVSIGITASIAIMLEVAIQTDQGGRLVMASISTITFLEIGKSANLYLQQMIGYFLGAFVAMAFLVGIVAFANDITIYLLGLAGLFGLLEWLASYFSNHTPILRGIIAMCSFSVFMVPAPDSNFHVAYGRITVSLLAFFVAIIVYHLVQEFKKLTLQLMKPKTQGLSLEA